jgi:muramidase (phage lysozyme)/ElaB/YqjD/DUF883 family membrane-anchored ribosome-binding protein
MTLSLEGLRAFVDNANVAASLRCVRRSELPKQYAQTDDAYRVLFCGELIDDLSRHPRIAKMSPWGWTSAAGAYQAMAAVPGKVTTDTWGDFCRDMGTTADEMPFDKDHQDCFAVWCLRRRHALQDAIQGRFEAVVEKCSWEWASWPPGRYGQPTVTLEALREVYEEYGGTYALSDLIQPEAPIEDRPQSSRPPESPQESRMPIPAIILGLIQAAASVLPVIAQIRGDKEQSSATKNVAIASKVLDVAVTTLGATNHQAAVEAVQVDPVAREKVDAALRAQFFDLMKYAQEQETAAWERSEKSVGDARSFAEKMLGQEGWQSIGFGALIGVLAILIIVGAGWMLWRIAELATTDQTTRGLIVGAAIAMLGQVVSYFFGSSSSSRQSGEALRNIAQGKQQ